MCCHSLFILFSCASEITQIPIYLWDRPICGDSEVHQPATGVDLSKAVCVQGTFSAVYDWEFEGSVRLFLLLGWKMNCQLLSTCSDMALHTVESFSACFMLGSPLWNRQFWKRGVFARRRREKGISPIRCGFLCSCGVVGGRSVPLTSVSPAELLSKMKWSKLGASLSSQSHYFASCTPRCCCVLHQASLIYIHSTSITAHLVLFTINQFSFPDTVSPIQKTLM